MPLRWILVATVVLALATLASCRGGSNEIDEALESVTPADLAIMVLPKQEIGNIADDFVVLAEGSGFDDSTSMAEGTIDPDDTAEDWERRGWLSAYCLNYSTPDLAAAVNAGREIAAVTTCVALFDDNAGASEALAILVDDGRRQVDVEIEGTTLTGFEELEVEQLGYESGASFTTADFEGFDFSTTTVFFRVGRLNGGVFVLRAGTVDARADAERIAGKLHDRIIGVLFRELTDVPVPIPPESND